MSDFSQHNKAAHLRASSIFACSLVSLMVIGGCSSSPSTSHLKDIIQSAQTELNNNKLDDAQDFSAQALAECKTWRMPLTDEQVALKNETLRLLEEVAKKNAEMGRLETASNIYQKALNLNGTDGWLDHQHTLEVALADLKSRQAMEDNLIFAAKPKIPTTRKDSQSFWTRVMEVEKLRNTGKLTEAVRKADELFKQVSTDTGSPVPEHIGALNMIVRIYDQQNRENEIIEILERTLKDHPASADGSRAGKFNEYDDAMIHAHALSQMASILTKQHKEAEAEAYARKSLALQEFYHNELSDSYAIALSQLAGILAELHTSPEEVVRLRYKADGIFEKLNRGSLVEAVCNKFNLADNLSLMSRWSEASKIFEQVVPLKDKYPQFIPLETLSRSVSAYAALHDDQRASTQEQIFLTHAKREKLSDADIAGAMLEWADIARCYGNLDASAKYYGEALALLETTNSPRGREYYAKATAGLGLTELHSNKPEKAQKDLQKALQLFSKLKPTIDFAGTLNSAAALEINKGNFDQALAYNREALKICTTLLGEAAEPTISTKNQMANTLYKQGKYQEALDLSRSAERNAMKARLKSPEAIKYGQKAALNFTHSMYMQLVYSTLNQSRSLLALTKQTESIQQLERCNKFMKSAVALEPESNHIAINAAIGKQYFALGMKVNGLEMYKASIADAKRLHTSTKEIEQELRDVQTSPAHIR